MSWLKSPPEVSAQNTTYMAPAYTKCSCNFAMGQDAFKTPNLISNILCNLCITTAFFYVVFSTALGRTTNISDKVIAVCANNFLSTVWANLCSKIGTIIPVVCPNGVYRCMGFTGNNHKIIESVVKFIPVDVVNEFINIERSVKVLTHHISTALDITIFSAVSVFWFKNKHVAIGNKFSTIPSWIPFPKINPFHDIAPLCRALYHEDTTIIRVTQGELYAIS